MIERIITATNASKAQISHAIIAGIGLANVLGAGISSETTGAIMLAVGAVGGAIVAVTKNLSHKRIPEE